MQLEQLRLAPSTINQRLAAVRRLAYEASDAGLLSPELAAGIKRVRGVKQLGVRPGNWLTAEQGRALVEAPSLETLRGKRDRAMLGVLLGCGLRRSELVHLRVEDVQQREDHCAIVDLVGKGGHVRTIPVPGWVKKRVDEWMRESGTASGRVFRSINKNGTVWGNGVTEKVVWYVVRNFAKALGLEKIAPHDLCRTCARLCHVAGGDLEQIQFLLGHVSVQTTERYLGSKQKIRDAVNDRIGIEPAE
jgi:site-specific recombinase XerD